MAAVRADLGGAGATAEAERAVLDRNRDPLPPAASGQVPLAFIGRQAVAMGIADVIEDHGFLFSRCGPQGPADHLQVKGKAGGGAHQDRATH